MKRFLTKIQISGLNPNLNRNDLVCCILSGLLLAFSFPPLEWSVLIWIALIPVLLRIQTGLTKRNAGLGFVTGLVFYTFHLYWIYYVTILGLILLIFYLSSILAFVFWGIGYCKTWRGGIVLAAFLWTGVEYLRSLGPFTFAWGYLGHSLYAWESLLQITYWVGVPGLSFLVFILNFSIAELLDLAITIRQKSLPLFWSLLVSKPLLQTSISLGLIFLTIFYGQKTIQSILDPSLPTKPFKIALIQANVPHEAEIPSTVKLIDYLKLSEKAMKEHPELIIWPESAMSISLNYWPEIVKSIQEFSDTYQVDLLTGTLYDKRIEAEKYNSYNRAVQFVPGEKFDYSRIPLDISPLQWYDKIQLVPFGEFVPYGKTWPLKYITPFIEQAIENAGVGLKEPGTKLHLFTTHTGIKYAVAICFESTLARQNARAHKKGADFLAVITYDSWFYRSAGLKQHFIQCAFRAAENRFYVVRAANTGITGVFGPTGRILKQYPAQIQGFCTYTLNLPLSK